MTGVGVDWPIGYDDIKRSGGSGWINPLARIRLRRELPKRNLMAFFSAAPGKPRLHELIRFERAKMASGYSNAFVHLTKSTGLSGVMRFFCAAQPGCQATPTSRLPVNAGKARPEIGNVTPTQTVQ